MTHARVIGARAAVLCVRPFMLVANFRMCGVPGFDEMQHVLGDLA